MYPGIRLIYLGIQLIYPGIGVLISGNTKIDIYEVNKWTILQK